MTEPGERLRTARCGCGDLSVVTRGEPLDIYACACVTCRARTGSAFSYAGLFRESAITIAGPFRLWRHQAESGRALENAFCPSCGAGVFFRTAAWPDLVGVAAGCFAEQDFPKPRRLYWAARRPGWLCLPADTPLIDTQ
ncbi:MAG: GFA family protein [Pseudorhodoplanes sp.]|nr:hypothetical protein [Pseudorhodoplanes sp.]MBW7948609.1 GFA family protein [Pseudorhodoplanes sp.]MCL4711056.1 GFA family protein [Pseudorhodoplanes sp.]MCQ3943339.1 aldehyde-activating protein [Alphaproteobacteria bacterium]GIK83109.1 MAG: aldehyde-activating protein [Alphaproteobacteria bacterium]